MGINECNCDGDRMPEVLSVSYVSGCALVYEADRNNSSVRVSVINLDNHKELANSIVYFVSSFDTKDVIRGLNATLAEEPYL